MNAAKREAMAHYAAEQALRGERVLMLCRFRDEAEAVVVRATELALPHASAPLRIEASWLQERPS